MSPIGIEVSFRREVREDPVELFSGNFGKRGERESSRTSVPLPILFTAGDKKEELLDEHRIRLFQRDEGLDLFFLCAFEESHSL